MKRKLILAAFIAVLSPALWLGFGQQEEGPDYAFGMGKKIAGGWVVTLNIGQPVDVLMTLAADGGVVASGQLRPAGPNDTGAWMGTRYNTTAHGSWSRIHRNEIEVVVLLQVQNIDGSLVFYEKVVMQMTLEKTGTAMEGTGSFQLFEAGIGPMDPGAPVFAQGPFTQTARLIH
jgi:hypothetical protein